LTRLISSGGSARLRRRDGWLGSRVSRTELREGAAEQPTEANQGDGALQGGGGGGSAVLIDREEEHKVVFRKVEGVDIPVALKICPAVRAVLQTVQSIQKSVHPLLGRNPQ